MRGPRAESSPARKRAALSAAGFWHRRRSKKSAVRNLRPDMEAAGGEKVPAAPHPLNHGALRLRGPFTSVALITRAHEAVNNTRITSRRFIDGAVLSSRCE